MELLPDFRVLYPTTVHEAVTLRTAGERVRFIAGGTDLVANMRRGLLPTEVLIDLHAIDELRRVEAGVEGLKVGAGVTLEALAAHHVVVRDYPALAQAAASIAGPTHRASATVGGNLCVDTRCRYYNQSEPWRNANSYCMKLNSDVCRVAPKAKRCYAAYSGDLAPAMMVLGAVAEIAGPQGRRLSPLAQVFADDGIRYLTLAPGELLVSVQLPPATGLRSAYEKLRVRDAIEFPLAGVAVALRRDGNGVHDLRVAVAGTDSRPLWIEGTDALRGAPDELASELERLVRRQIGPMETTLTPAAYRRRVVPVLARRLLQRLSVPDA